MTTEREKLIDSLGRAFEVVTDSFGEDSPTAKAIDAVIAALSQPAGVPDGPTDEQLARGRKAIMALQCSSPRWPVRKHYEAAGYDTAGIPDYLLDMRCPMPKENRAELLWYAMRGPAAPPPPAAQQDEGDIYSAYETWPVDIRKKLSMHDLRRMSGWRPSASLDSRGYMTRKMAFDLSPTLVKGEIKNKLIEMGWTPPGECSTQVKVSLDGPVMSEMDALVSELIAACYAIANYQWPKESEKDRFLSAYAAVSERISTYGR